MATFTTDMDARRAPPHPVNEQSYYQAVIGFLKNNVPKSVIGQMPVRASGLPEDTDKAERVLWSHFDGSGLPSDDITDHQLPYLLIGYETGLQVWNVCDAQNVAEVLSLRRDAMSCARVLTAPRSTSQDRFAASRPLLAFCDLEKNSESSSVHLLSMATNKQLSLRISVRGAPVVRIESNSHVLAVCVDSRIELYFSGTLEAAGTFACHTQPQLFVFPLALGSRWMAFASNTPLAASDEERSATLPLATPPSASLSAVVGMAQKTGNNLLHLGGKGVRRVTDMIHGVHTVPDEVEEPTPASQTEDADSGTVMIVDTADPTGPIVAHFRAHDGVPIAALAFDNAGTILVSACVSGQDINVFHLGRQAYHLEGSSPGSVNGGGAGVPGAGSGTVSPTEGRHVRTWRLVAQHMYVLQRGLTTATICDISFSPDSRWVALTSERGTTHVFPINPRGGPVTARTHTSLTVRNASSFETSSGLAEVKTPKKAEIVPGALVKLRYPNMLSAPDADDSKPRVLRASPAVVNLLAQTSAMSTCFKLLSSAGAELAASPDASGRRALLLTFLVCNASGELVEHKMHPYASDPTSKTEAARFAMAVGGVSVGDRANLASGVLSSLGTAFQNVRGVVRDAVSGSKHRLHRSDVPDDTGFGMACAATRTWDVCRHESWAPAHHRVTMHHRRMTPAARHHGHDHAHSFNPNPAAATAAASSDMASPWLSQVEISTYRPPHRPLWMGPQFTFGTFQSGPAEPAANAANTTATNSMHSEQSKLRFAEVGGSATRPLPVSRFAEAMHVVTVDIAGSPWQGATPPQLADPTVREDLRAAMDDPGDEDEDDDNDDLNGNGGDHTPTSNDTMFDMDMDVQQRTPRNKKSSSRGGGGGGGVALLGVDEDHFGEGAQSTPTAAAPVVNGQTGAKLIFANGHGSGLNGHASRPVDAVMDTPSPPPLSNAASSTPTPLAGQNATAAAATRAVGSATTAHSSADASGEHSESDAGSGPSQNTAAAGASAAGEGTGKKSKRRKGNAKIAAVNATAAKEDDLTDALKDQANGQKLRAAGLATALGAVEGDMSMPRVHSGVSLSGLSEALSEP
eukprot:m.106174 g.106174  ORF g.106174 m.106174 type:complete len:1085 (-) comp15810_c0_seq2:383-3637(-)